MRLFLHLCNAALHWFWSLSPLIHSGKRSYFLCVTFFSFLPLICQSDTCFSAYTSAFSHSRCSSYSIFIPIPSLPSIRFSLPCFPHLTTLSTSNPRTISPLLLPPSTPVWSTHASPSPLPVHPRSANQLGVNTRFPRRTLLPIGSHQAPALRSFSEYE